MLTCRFSGLLLLLILLDSFSERHPTRAVPSGTVDERIENAVEYDETVKKV